MSALPTTPRLLSSQERGRRVRAGIAEHLRRIESPEVRALREFYAQAGKTADRQVRKLDPRQHALGCQCRSCDRAERPCPHEGCERVITGLVKMAQHLGFHDLKLRKIAEKARRVAAHVAKVPKGAEFLAALLGDSQAAGTIDTRALREMQERLFPAAMEHRQPAHTKRLATLRHDLEVMLTPAYPRTTSSQLVKVTYDIRVVVLRLSLLAGVQPTTVYAALIEWGIEKLARDLRAARAAVPPKIATTLAQPRAPQASSAFPRAEGGDTA